MAENKKANETAHMMFDLIKKPISTEKIMRLIEEQNTLCFEVALHAKKADIKSTVEDYFKVKVVKVNTTITPKGKKRAFVKLAPDFFAMDIATQLGFI